MKFNWTVTKGEISKTITVHVLDSNISNSNSSGLRQ